MDIYFNLMLICAIVVLFIILKYTINPYVYIGIIMLSVIGLVVSVLTDLYLIIGTESNIVFNGTKAIGVISTPLITSLGAYNYIIQLFYLMTMIGSIIYWSIDNPKDIE